jgi:hypothetical protein
MNPAAMRSSLAAFLRSMKPWSQMYQWRRVVSPHLEVKPSPSAMAMRRHPWNVPHSKVGLKPAIPDFDRQTDSARWAAVPRQEHSTPDSH